MKHQSMLNQTGGLGHTGPTTTGHSGEDGIVVEETVGMGVGTMVIVGAVVVLGAVVVGAATVAVDIQEVAAAVMAGVAIANTF